jgi:aryl-alcohol dehydrogenase-like predicted oxidoreductase
MQYRQLGKSSLQVSMIGFGCMSLEENGSTNTQLLHKAIELGTNFFDTADLYQKGINEEMIGLALKEKRNDVIIAGKVGNQWRSDGSGWDWNPRKEYILSSIDKSLQRLQTDHIDLYQLHGGTIEDPIDETIEAFEQLVKQGKIRYYGISSIRPNVIREYVKRSNIVSVMMQYSLLDRRPEEECLDLLLKSSIGVLARGPLAKGLLAGKPAAAYADRSAQEVKQAGDAIKLVTGNRTLSQTAVQFVLHHPAVTSAIAGIRTMEQLEDVIGDGDVPPLTQKEYMALIGAVSVNRYDTHR